ncbi:hypothetical protein B0H19DRAFT_544903 [Mycena capillaripes]|nr:hypothetical protein B0H19DRAFT_544903 [Mycena capillaripes]
MPKAYRCVQAAWRQTSAQPCRHQPTCADACRQTLSVCRPAPTCADRACRPTSTQHS